MMSTIRSVLALSVLSLLALACTEPNPNSCATNPKVCRPGTSCQHFKDSSGAPYSKCVPSTAEGGNGSPDGDAGTSPAVDGGGTRDMEGSPADAAGKDTSGPPDTGLSPDLPILSDTGACSGACVVGTRRCNTAGTATQDCLMMGACPGWASDVACAAGMACRSDQSGSACRDTSAPTIMSVTPANGATGVLETAKIVIRFSEPMAQAVTESAWTSTDLPRSAVQFSWGSNGSELTVTPRNLLEYIEGNRADLTAKSYSFSITTAATDAAGNALAAGAQWSFTTLRRLTLTLKSVRALTGNVRSDGTVNLEGGLQGGETTLILAGDSAAVQGAYLKGFVTFGLADVPAGATAIEYALLRLYQRDASSSAFTALGKLNVDHATFGNLDLPAFGAAAIPPGVLGVISMTASDGWRVLEVTDAVRNDHQNRNSRSSRSQFRLFFDRMTNNDFNVDSTYFADTGKPNEPELQVKCLAP